MKNKAKLVYRCDLGKCDMAKSKYDCYGYDICDQCELCTEDGMVIEQVERDGVVYEVSGVSGDELFIVSHEPLRLISLRADIEKFMREFKVVKTRPDYRRGGYPPEFAELEAKIKELYEENGLVYEV